MRNRNAITTNLCLLLIVLLLSSCSTNRSQVVETSQYQKNNDKLIEDLKSNIAYKSSDFGGISEYKYYYKVLEEAPAENKAVRPFQNSKVLVEYSISLAYSQQVIVPQTQAELTIFDIPDNGSTPIGQVTGLQYVLQEMEVGDHWEIILPWQLGYGSYAKGVIPAHSALKYDIKLLEITKP